MKSNKYGLAGQSALEYLIILSAALALLTSITITQAINPSKDAAEHSLCMMQASATAGSIAGAIDTIYANGAGAAKSLLVKIDCTWTMQTDNLKNVLRFIFWSFSGTENLEVNLQYKIQKLHSLPMMPPGVCSVIVSWPENKNFSETMQVDETDDRKIYIYLDPEG